MHTLILAGLLMSICLMVIAKRTTALIRSFRYQSFFLFLATLISALTQKNNDLYIISGLLFVLKVTVIPYILFRVAHRIKANESIGLFVNTQLSLVCVLGFMYGAFRFSHLICPSCDTVQAMTFTAALSVTLAGLFLMIVRLTALAQIIGLLVMENGLFLLASTVSGGMPFIVEIAIFFDVFVSVVIMGFFVYRINRLFTHINVNKLSQLKG